VANLFTMRNISYYSCQDDKLELRRNVEKSTVFLMVQLITPGETDVYLKGMFGGCNPLTLSTGATVLRTAPC
jgi:hypothetical protein